MEITDTYEYIVLNGKATVCFHGTPDEEKIKKAAIEFIKAVLKERNLSVLPD